MADYDPDFEPDNGESRYFCSTAIRINGTLKSSVEIDGICTYKYYSDSKKVCIKVQQWGEIPTELMEITEEEYLNN